ncbi:MAG: class I SAM-dependent methyltransferase [Vampirovibrionales bacterium]
MLRATLYSPRVLSSVVPSSVVPVKRLGRFGLEGDMKMSELTPSLDTLTLSKPEQAQVPYLKKALHEVWKNSQNGLMMSGLKIQNQLGMKSELLTDRIHQADRVLKEELPHHQHVKTFVSSDEVQPQYFVLSQLGQHKPYMVFNPLSKTSLPLAKHIGEMFGHATDETSLKQLQELNQTHPDSVIQTLASEYLSEQGKVTIPHTLKQQVLNRPAVLEKTADLHLRGEKTLGTGFSDRIDVNSYTYFEYVHPAYARQVTVMADMVKKYAPQASQAIDIGTGPGSALKFFHELLPEIHVKAIEPDKEAFHMLSQAFKDNQKITPVYADFLKYTDKKVPLALSTGASHHLDTYGFLLKAHELLDKGGVFIVADEMITPFHNVEERSKNLILHHTKYMLDIMHHPPKEALLTKDEKVLLHLLQANIPKAYHLASNHQVSHAVQLLKQTDEALRKLDLKPNHISHPEVAFYRLQFLELQALTAGLDYQVEQKTSPEQFKRMAKQAGFQVLEHQRVYATHGSGSNDAGTHVIALRKK